MSSGRAVGLAVSAWALAVAAWAREIWQDPTAFARSRLPARAVMVPCESAETALAIARGERPRTASPYLLSLNGAWRFRWKGNVDAPDWEKSATLAVPGCWQLQGDFDPPLYVNVTYPIAGCQTGDPTVPPPAHYTSARLRTPVGLYERSFRVPEAWRGRRVVVHFGGVSSALELSLNGRVVGYSQDSRLPAEFDLTPYLEPGENRIAAKVFKHCDGTYLEDQDFWRLSGLFRDVWLVAEAPAAPKDLVLEATLSDDFAKGRAVVRDERGKVLFERAYDKPKLWDAGSPNLEYVAFAAGGDYFALPVGFRKVEIRDAVLRINGRRVLFKGVNRHEMEPSTGYAVTLAGMRRDIEIMKDLNVNAVRTCHYPDDPQWYDLCDRAGLYVVCEANVEAHGVAGYYEDGKSMLPANPLYREQIVSRHVNMVRTLRNHPCVVIWSLGNESGDGPAMAEGYKAVKALDPTRPVQYEPAQHTDHSDVMCPMYMRPWDCENYVKSSPKKPFVLCEYAHAMGNSLGDLDAYWSLAARYPSFQGGFVWDFADQALWQAGKGGARLAYGGDFGDAPNDGNFNCNGIVAADRTYHPGAYELRRVYAGLPPAAAPAFKAPACADGDPIEEHPFRLNFWRAPTDNDRGWNMASVCAAWREATAKQRPPKGCTAKLRVAALGAGRCRVDLEVEVGEGLAPVPRVGVTFQVPREFTRVAWTGRGPFENYADRKGAAAVGDYDAVVGVSSGLCGADGEIAYVANGLNPDNYVEPGEQGHRCDCTQLALSDGSGRSIRVTALSGPFGFNAWPYSQEALERASHQGDLKAEEAITVSIDAAMMGVGGDNSWGNRPHDDFMPGAGRYRLSLLVEGLLSKVE